MGGRKGGREVGKIERRWEKEMEVDSRNKLEKRGGGGQKKRVEGGGKVVTRSCASHVMIK